MAGSGGEPQDAASSSTKQRRRRDMAPKASRNWLVGNREPGAGIGNWELACATAEEVGESGDGDGEPRATSGSVGG